MHTNNLLDSGPSVKRAVQGHTQTVVGLPDCSPAQSLVWQRGNSELNCIYTGNE